MNASRTRCIPLCAVLALVATVLAACDVNVRFRGSGVRGDGVARTELRRVASFDEIRFDGEGRLEVVLGASQRVELEGDSNLLPRIETVVDGNLLRVRATEDIEPELDLVVRVSAPALRAVGCSGTGSIDVRGVDEDDFAVHLSGAATVELAGRADRLELNLSGVGSVEAEELVAREASVRVSGVGKAHVNATDKLDVRVSGVGGVTYRGEPEVKQRVSGLGRVSRRD